jgi:hypothetical protein
MDPMHAWTSEGVFVCVECLFLRSPSRAPNRTPSACAKRAAYQDLPQSPTQNPSLPRRSIPRRFVADGNVLVLREEGPGITGEWSFTTTTTLLQRRIFDFC